MLRKIFTFLLFIPALALAIATQPDNTRQPLNFWAKGFQAQWISQTQAGTTDQYFGVKPGDTVTVTAKFKNTGTETWYNSPNDRQVCIAIYKDEQVQSSWSGYDNKNHPYFGTSEFQAIGWENDYRISCIEEMSVAPGEVGTFVVNFFIPDDAPSGKWREDITLASGPYWMGSIKETADPIGAAHIWVGFNIQSTLPTPVPTFSSLQNYMLELINQDRASQGKGPMLLDTTLTKIAYDHSKDQAENLKTISHTGSDGSTLGERLALGGASYQWAGENVGMTKGVTDTKEAVEQIESMFFNETPPNDGHRRNILSDNFHKIGIGIYVKGDEVYVTQDFTD